jgi:hypothetical protein
MSDQPEVANVCVWGEVVAVSDVLEPACTRSNERSDVREPATGNILRNTPEGHSMNETWSVLENFSLGPSAPQAPPSGTPSLQGSRGQDHLLQNVIKAIARPQFVRIRAADGQAAAFAYFFPSYTILPPTMVISGLMAEISSAGTVR